MLQHIAAALMILFPHRNVASVFFLSSFILICVAVAWPFAASFIHSNVRARLK